MTSSDSLETLFATSGASFRLLTDEQRKASLDASLAHWNGRDDLWVYGYGSLIWRPEFNFTESRPALLRGYHRSLCLWSHVNRGTPERPGLVFGLDIGGSCRGMVYRIPAEEVPHTLTQLWVREMPSGAYLPKWLSCASESGHVQALSFVMDRSQDAYVRDLTHEQLVAIVRDAHGVYGSCIEYVLETAHALEDAGIHDRKLDALVRELKSLSATAS
ncbi:gamma-glutamylcyclotransferase [Pusillimonas sp.]|uniref:gamma-glutamylcyclotransferase n=1 Tax=Pusillimonas sp. TaxID=3040095 RepID=UPI0037C5791F